MLQSNLANRSMHTVLYLALVVDLPRVSEISRDGKLIEIGL